MTDGFMEGRAELLEGGAPGALEESFEKLLERLRPHSLLQGLSFSCIPRLT
jgi:hypothetical protein